MKILGIESTCDETGISVVEDGLRIISNIVSSSVNMHKKYGGVVPEVAAREQIKVIIPAIDQALGSLKPADIDAIAVSYGPGLVGSLLVGVETAKALSVIWNKPLYRVNHLQGHLYSCFLGTKTNPKFPLLALIVSGGHTDLVFSKSHGHVKLLGSTLDDACGEAFDKVARVIGLHYPGGPDIEKLASTYDSNRPAVKFPRPMIVGDNFNFSFSGIKSSVVNFWNKSDKSDSVKAEIAYSFQEAAIDVLISKTKSAFAKFEAKNILVGGGVAANSKLREKMFNVFGDTVIFPTKVLSVDNGAMIASAAFFVGKKSSPLKINANPSLHF